MSGKTPSEKQTRDNLMGWAKKYGCTEELMKIFAKYDEWIAHAKSEDEKKALQAMGVMEVEQFFTGKKQMVSDLLVNYTPINEYGKIK
jgi:hypothetical protein